jgi:hypothetical protein
MTNVLATTPKYFRAPISRGGDPRVDREGGYRQAGLIRGVSVISKGEALGHGLYIDDVALEQVETLVNAQAHGIKSRFTHPSMSGDGLGKHVARVRDAELAGDRVIADQHFLQSAHKTPDGDLAEYLMSLAEEDPTSYGLSIAFQHDQDAMDLYQSQHMIDGEFRSPDPLNVHNYPHVRITDLHAADSVDEPAANPSGLFHREDDLAKQFDELAAYAFGLTNDRPTSAPFDPDRVRGFAVRFLTNHELLLRKDNMDDSMVTETNEATAEQPVEPTTTPVQEPTEREEANRFRAKFGDKGAVWFAEGLSFDEARDREVDELRKENDTLKQKLAARPLDGEDSPVAFDAADQKTRNGFASKIRLK